MDTPTFISHLSACSTPPTPPTHYDFDDTPLSSRTPSPSTQPPHTDGPGISSPTTLVEHDSNFISLPPSHSQYPHLPNIDGDGISTLPTFVGPNPNIITFCPYSSESSSTTPSPPSTASSSPLTVIMSPLNNPNSPCNSVRNPSLAPFGKGGPKFGPGTVGYVNVAGLRRDKERLEIEKGLLEGEVRALMERVVELESLVRSREVKGEEMGSVGKEGNARG